jgi:hypothetical protein
MKWLGARQFARTPTTATLVATMAVLIPLMARSQQEVEPTWFDPWAGSHPTSARPARVQAADHQDNNHAASSLTNRHKGKEEVRGRHVAMPHARVNLPERTNASYRIDSGRRAYEFTFAGLDVQLGFPPEIRRLVEHI